MRLFKGVKQGETLFYLGILLQIKPVWWSRRDPQNGLICSLLLHYGELM